MSDIDGVPFVAFGNDELEGAPRVAKGDRIRCALCDSWHVVGLGTSEDGTESPLIQFITCGETTYMVGLNGKSVMKADGPFTRTEHSQERHGG